jgi:epoxyqueuosine reductase QueG
MSLQEGLTIIARGQGATFFGVADLSLAKEGVITPNERKLIAEFPFGVSIGVPLNPAVVGAIHDQSDSFAMLNYWHHYIQQINPLVTLIMTQISLALTNQGYSAMSVPAVQRFDQSNMYGFFSHKMTAHLAGLGWIGKSCLLITPGCGPRVRWGTVLTNAQLKAGQPLESQCGDCRLCVDACPAGAFTGKDFSPQDWREDRMNVEKCESHIKGRKEQTGVSACGMCVNVCPFGNRSLPAQAFS